MSGRRADWSGTGLLPSFCDVFHFKLTDLSAPRTAAGSDEAVFFPQSQACAGRCPHRRPASGKEPLAADPDADIAADICSGLLAGWSGFACCSSGHPCRCHSGQRQHTGGPGANGRAGRPAAIAGGRYPGAAADAGAEQAIARPGERGRPQSAGRAFHARCPGRCLAAGAIL